MIRQLIILLLLGAFSVTAPTATPSQKGKAKTTVTDKNGNRAPKKNKSTSSNKNANASTSRSEFIVISKRDLNLRVYGKQGNDTVLLAQYPVCLSKNKGNKQRVGDMKTPESPAGKPFKITQIQDASTWKHDFKDGRGSILSYGHWFLRLLTPGHSGIGIHGSTNNENTVPGRDSEGCIRLRDNDIIDLKQRFAYVGMPVIIKGENDGLYPWETRVKSH